MVSTGIVQLIEMGEEIDVITNLGYPVYILTILGIWKMLGVVAVLIPKFPLVKEWAYAGFLKRIQMFLQHHTAKRLVLTDSF